MLSLCIEIKRFLPHESRKRFFKSNIYLCIILTAMWPYINYFLINVTIQCMCDFVILFYWAFCRLNWIQSQGITMPGSKKSWLWGAKWVKNAYLFENFLLPQTKRNHMKCPRFLCMSFGVWGLRKCSVILQAVWTIMLQITTNYKNIHHHH